MSALEKFVSAIELSDAGRQALRERIKAAQRMRAAEEVRTQCESASSAPTVWEDTAPSAAQATGDAVVVAFGDSHVGVDRIFISERH